MTKIILKPKNLEFQPRPTYPYSPGTKAGNMIYISGQIPLNPETMELVEGEESQIRQVFDNISAICEEANCSINDIVKLNVSLQDLSMFSLVNEVMSELFTEPYPARAALQVARLPLDSLIEVEAIIVKSN